jgi:hypothetical protein
MAGETVSVSGATVRAQKGHVGSGVFAIPFALTFSSTNNQTADVMEAGYLPPYTRCFAVGWHPSDMDIDVSPAAVHKVTIGAVDVVSALSGAQTGAASLTPVTQTAALTATSASPQLVSVTTTTAAATAAAGTATLVLWCQNAAT